MPRSGTTWIGKIFDSHPDTLYRHEPDSRGSLNSLPIFAFHKDAEKYRPFLKAYVAQLPAIRGEKVSASIPIFAKNYYSAAQWTLRKLIVLIVKPVAHILDATVPDVINLSDHTDIAVTWKSIESLGRLGVLAKVFPAARCILIMRHPCGYIASIKKGERQQEFDSEIKSSEDWNMFRLLLQLPAAKKLGLELAAVKVMLPIERLALRWALYYEHVLTETEGLNNVLTIRYEDFCEHPQEEAQKAFRHCHLSWAVETERFIANSTSKENSAYYSVFKNSKAASAKWEKELGKEDVNRVMEIVAQFKAGSYYPPAV